MIDYNEWNERKNANGGYDPIDKEDKNKFKKADLITLPKGIQGTNCSNCMYFENGICNHQKLKGAKVTKRNCCAYWDHKNVDRKF